MTRFDMVEPRRIEQRFALHDQDVGQFLPGARGQQALAQQIGVRVDHRNRGIVISVRNAAVPQLPVIQQQTADQARSRRTFGQRPGFEAHALG